MKTIKYLYIYLIAINLIGFYLMGSDKRKAQKQKWRISEKSLFAIAFLGGAVGIRLGMSVFHHKIRDNRFKYGIPAIILLYLAAAIAIMYYINPDKDFTSLQVSLRDLYSIDHEDGEFFHVNSLT